MLVDQFGNPIETETRQVRRRAERLQARYEAATLKELDNRFALANNSSADLVDSPGVRKRLSARGRYEFRNNSYARGVALRFSNEIVGSGPRISIEAENEDAANELEETFNEWADETSFAEGLQTAFVSLPIDGEVFGVEKVDRSLDVPLRLQWFPCEYFSGFDWRHAGSSEIVDGITLNGFDQPTNYMKWKFHPTGTRIGNNSGNGHEHLPASQVYHLYRKFLPDQHRGTCEIAPALHLFNQLRNYTLATLGAAEIAAKIAGFFETTNTQLEPEEWEGQLMIDIPRNQIGALPKGMKYSGVKAEQPVTTYGEFKREVLAEIFACLLLTYAEGAGDSSSENFASGKLGRGPFRRAIKAIRKIYLEKKILRRVWRSWFELATLSGFVPSNLGRVKSVNWFYDRYDSLDEEKSARAAVALKDAGLLDETEFWNERQLSLDEAYRRIARAKELRTKNGLDEAETEADNEPQEEGLPNVAV